MNKSNLDLNSGDHLDRLKHLGVHRAPESGPLVLQPEQCPAAHKQEGRARYNWWSHGHGVSTQALDV